jgi:hypothetical protein
MKIVAVFPSIETARAGLGQLSAVHYELYSTEPMDPPHVPSGLLKGAIIGGVAGGAGGAALAIVTARSMGLPVGGMPIPATAPVGIVTFALTALGAVGAVLMVLLWQGDLLTLRLPLPDEVRKQVANGAVAVAIEVEEQQSGEITAMLAKAGATRVA